MRPVIVSTVLKLLSLHGGGGRVSGPRQRACAPPSRFQRQVLLGGLLLPEQEESCTYSTAAGPEGLSQPTCSFCCWMFPVLISAYLS